MAASTDLLEGVERLLGEGRVARAVRLLRDAGPTHPGFAPAGARAAAAGGLIPLGTDAQRALLATAPHDDRMLAALFAGIEPLGAGDPWSAALRHALRGIGTGDGARARAGFAVVLEQLGLDPAGANASPLAPVIARALERLARGGPRLAAADDDVMVVDGAVGPAGCDFLRDAATARGLQPALVLDPVSGERRPHPHRTSESVQLPRGVEDPVVDALVHQLAGLTGLGARHAEPVVVLRYRPGQEYRPHGDWLPAATAADESLLARFGQRTHTVMLYLNTPTAGGALQFPERARTIDAVAGRAVCFRNTDAAGRPLQDSLHASVPVVDGEKWAMSLWFRAKPVLV